MIRYRLATPDDLHCAVENMTDSYRKSYYACWLPMDPPDWSEIMRPIVHEILARPGVEVIVAYDPAIPAESKADIYGWLAVRRQQPTTSRGPRVVAYPGKPVVIYVYVKANFRGLGVATGLFREAGIDPWGQQYTYVARSPMLYQGAAGKLPLIARIGRARWAPFEVRRGYGDGKHADDETRWARSWSSGGDEA